MTAGARREQLITIGRSLFAHEGYQAVSVEEIAAAAHVSKPIVYEHFGGKEGLYAVIVDREMRTLTQMLTSSLQKTDDHPRHLTEKAALALMTYIDEHEDGFQILIRDSPVTQPESSFNSLLGDISVRVEDLLSQTFRAHGIPVETAPFYAQMLVGMVVYTGQYWAAHHQVSKEKLAADIVNLAWNGLSRMSADPHLQFEGAEAQQRWEALQKQKARQQAHDLKTAQKVARKVQKAESKAERKTRKAQEKAQAKITKLEARVGDIDIAASSNASSVSSASSAGSASSVSSAGSAGSAEGVLSKAS
jgi:AcrR family transcriptional regulator